MAELSEPLHVEDETMHEDSRTTCHIHDTDSLAITIEAVYTQLHQVMYSKFWPRGGLPGILHHYVCTKQHCDRYHISEADIYTLLDRDPGSIRIHKQHNQETSQHNLRGWPR